MQCAFPPSQKSQLCLLVEQVISSYTHPCIQTKEYSGICLTKMKHCSQFRHNFCTMLTGNIILIILILFYYPNQTESAAHAKLKITGYNRLPYGLTYCEKDTDCDENEFCRFYADLSYCHICIDCYGYYRRKVPEGGCAKNRSLCSDCIPGYRFIQGECVKVKNK